MRVTATTARLVGTVALILCVGLVTFSSTSKAIAATSLPAGFVEELVAGGLGLSGIPTAMEFAPDGRLFVAQNSGSLRVIENGILLPTPFLQLTTVTDGERGLLGVAFDPDFASNGHVYVYYTHPGSIQNRVSRFTASSDPNVADPDSEVVVLDGIPSETIFHNAGAIHFGLDGKLYVAVGDNADPSNSQSLATLAGKILRIDPSACTAVCSNIIPLDNPFVTVNGARGEIWALGLRNPFTFAVDPVGGRININDVGERSWEEINVGIPGANYGWPVCEGKCSPSNPAFADPVFAYRNKGSAAITGGAFYRGSSFPGAFVGDYFFADYVKGFIKRLTSSGRVNDFAEGASSPVDLKVGPDGHLYYLSLFDGAVYRIRPVGAGPSGKMHVDNISLTAKQKGSLWEVTALVLIVLDTGAPVTGAVVTVGWSVDGTSLKTESAQTDSAGTAKFSTGRIVQTGQEVTIAVTGVAFDGLTYDPTANIETSDSTVAGP
jgi:glucose/arabinose dehydrogenase